MWRLMASVLVVSDAGSVALVSDHTDWPSEQRCLQVIEEMYSTPPTATLANGIKVTITTKARCLPMRDVLSPTAGYTPPPPPQPPRPPYWVR